MKPKKTNSVKIKPGKKPVKTEKDKWILRLYVAGQTPKAITALANLKKIGRDFIELFI